MSVSAEFRFSSTKISNVFLVLTPQYKIQIDCIASIRLCYVDGSAVAIADVASNNGQLESNRVHYYWDRLPRSGGGGLFIDSRRSRAIDRRTAASSHSKANGKYYYALASLVAGVLSL